MQEFSSVAVAPVIGKPGKGKVSYVPLAKKPTADDLASLKGRRVKIDGKVRKIKGIGEVYFGDGTTVAIWTRE